NRKPIHNTDKKDFHEKAPVLNKQKVKIRAILISRKKVADNMSIQRCRRDSRFFCIVRGVQLKKEKQAVKIMYFNKSEGYD
ncbi:hypothetical protein, partial [Hydrotalea sp.]|uniref:hypothetical protein n=1 Tax=Hydrotalea sp. TaxID=2881279 RepID=UPI00258FDA51